MDDIQHPNTPIETKAGGWNAVFTHLGIGPSKRRRPTPMSVAVPRDVTNPLALEEVHRGIRLAKSWRKISIVCEVASHFLLGLVAIVSFLQAYFEHPSLSITAGCLSTVAIVLLKYASYASQECADSNVVVARMLQYLHVAPLPDLMATT